MTSVDAGVPWYLGRAEAAVLVAIILAAFLLCPDSTTLTRWLLDAQEVQIARATLSGIEPPAQAGLAQARLKLLWSELALQEGRARDATALAREAADSAPAWLPALVRNADVADILCRPEVAFAYLRRADALRRKLGAVVGRHLIEQLPDSARLDPGVLPTADSIRGRLDEWLYPYELRLAWYARWYQDLDLAIATTQELARERPEDAELGMSLAQLLTDRGDSKASIQALAGIRGISPDSATIQEILARRFRWRREPDRAARAIMQAGLKHQEAREQILEAYLEAGRPQDAIPALVRCFPRQESDGIPIRMELIKLVEGRGDVATALQLALDARKALGDDPRLLEELAQLEAERGDHRAAATIYVRLRRLQPRDPQLAREAMWELSASGQSDLALAQLEDLTCLEPSNPQWRRDLGIQLAQIGQMARARPILEECVRADPTDEEAVFQLAQVLGSIGDPMESARYYRQVLAMREKQSRPNPPQAAIDRGSPDRPVPERRRVLALYKKAEHERSDLNWIHTSLELPLNHLGLVVDYRAAEDPLPDDDAMSPYRGVITWFHTEELRGAQDYVAWLAHQADRGVHLVVMARPGCIVDSSTGRPLSPDALQRLEKVLGLHFGSNWTDDPQEIQVQSIDRGMCEFERPLAYEKTYFREIASTDPAAHVYLSLVRTTKPPQHADAVVIGPRAAFCLEDYAIYFDTERELGQWRLNPFRFLSAALGLADTPRLDFTTLDGERIVYCHLDGDGARAPCQWQPARRNSEVFLSEILARRDLPFTVSFIAGQIDPAQGIDPATLWAERAILSDPRVEAANHTYSHPMDWQDLAPSLRILGYDQVDLRREIVGAARTIETALLAPGRKVNVVLWSGKANPGREALEIADEAHLLNLNGGGPRLDGNHPSLLQLCPPRRIVGGHTQYLTSAANDFDLTEYRNTPDVAYLNVLQTFKRTESPRRLLPVNVYFHFDLLGTSGGFAALNSVLDWVDHHALHPLVVSQYIHVVQGFDRGVIERIGTAAWRIRDQGDCRTVRFDAPKGDLDWERSRNVAGSVRDGQSLYVHLASAQDAVVALTASPRPHPHVERSSAPVEQFDASAAGLTFSTDGQGRRRIVLAGLSGSLAYHVRIAHPPGRSTETVQSAGPDGRLTLVLDLAGPESVAVRPEQGAPR